MDMQEELLEKHSEQETLSKKMELIGERKEEITGKINHGKQDAENYKTMITELKQQRGTSQNELKALMNVEEQMTGKIKEFAEKRDKLYKQSVSIENELDKLNTRMESYLDLISRAKYRLPTLEGTIQEFDQELALYKVDVKEEQLPNKLHFL